MAEGYLIFYWIFFFLSCLGYNWQTWNRACGKEESRVHDMPDPIVVVVPAVSDQVEDQRRPSTPRYNEYMAIWRAKLVNGEIAYWYKINNITYVYSVYLCIKIMLKYTIKYFANIWTGLKHHSACQFSPNSDNISCISCNNSYCNDFANKSENTSTSAKKGKLRKAGMRAVVEPQASMLHEGQDACVQVLWHWENENRKHLHQYFTTNPKNCKKQRVFKFGEALTTTVHWSTCSRDECFSREQTADFQICPKWACRKVGCERHKVCHNDIQGGWGGWPTGNGKKLSSCQAQLCQATCLAVA